MKQICKISGKEFEISQEDQFYYKKMGLPLPTLCPDERQRRRLAWRNERNLYYSTCDATGKKIISMYSSDKPYKVYDTEYWNSDKWDAKEYSQDFDLNRPFFEQFAKLLKKVPLISRATSSNENCDFVNRASWNKNCYLVVDAGNNLDCYYSEYIGNSKDCCDCSYTSNSELCYECLYTDSCYDCQYLNNSDNCLESYFLNNCSNCKNCFGCINIENKQYYIFNEAYSKEDYKNKIKELKLYSHSQIETIKETMKNFNEKAPKNAIYGVNNEDSSGNHIYNTKNCNDCYSVANSEDCKYLYDCGYAKDCYDINFFGQVRGIQNCYECHEIGHGVQNIYMSDGIIDSCNNIYYSKDCSSSNNLFGCIGLNHSKYCIFNKQYSKKEYNEILPKIIRHMEKTGEWGEFYSNRTISVLLQRNNSSKLLSIK